MKVFFVLFVVSMALIAGCTGPQGYNNINDFESCVSAGFPIMESYPRQCRGPTGEVYVEQIEINDDVLVN